ncbi:MAG TPA: radical SAM protein [Smithellaceae bacterium]|nr:radical SAM protein [Smithellaceae bacterium]HNY97065.1 radical SAM protein [Smithellaceae bacterium]HOD64405.1 radical SAM protein [Smithellaceae bacterium]HOE22302.1 radical SAM protein [Smithellaceae bacterium]HOH57857.1 radical SAM protein [Smithellaceae bacterium]
MLQCTIGCSHNQCAFCGMYKDKKYRVRRLREILDDIRMAKDYYGDVEKVFLCDGDAIAIETETLLQILQALYATFPSLRHVGSYVGPQSTLTKSPDELRVLRSAGLTKAYIGVETGDDELLKKVHKGVGRAEMLEAGRRLVEAGINLSAMVLLGLAGPGEPSRRHALATAQICDEMKPQYLAALTVTPVPGTVLYRQVQKGEFQLLDPFETLAEMKMIFENITLDPLKFVGTHASNYLPVTGTLQKDKQKMIALVDSVLTGRDGRLLRPDHLRGL